jgi:hypothetical protein
LSQRSIRVIRTDLQRVQDAHKKLNNEIDALQRRQGLGNSMDLQRMKNSREGLRRRIVELKQELAAAEAAEKPNAVEGDFKTVLEEASS